MVISLEKIKTGIIGDRDMTSASHQATEKAIQHAADYLSLETEITWLPTRSFLSEDGLAKLADFHCIWGAPGDAESREGAIAGIKQARLNGQPYIGT
jgi:CTP synthase (UTP-ammonia lyase)